MDCEVKINLNEIKRRLSKVVANRGQFKSSVVDIIKRFGKVYEDIAEDNNDDDEEVDK